MTYEQKSMIQRLLCWLGIHDDIRVTGKHRPYTGYLKCLACDKMFWVENR